MDEEVAEKLKVPFVKLTSPLNINALNGNPKSKEAVTLSTISQPYTQGF